MKSVTRTSTININNNNDIEEATFKGYLFQYAVTFSGTLLLTGTAVSLGWASPTLPKLLADNSPVPITKNESSWLASLLLLGAIVGALPGAWMMDRFGRKMAILLSTIPLFIGWTLIAFAKSVPVLYASRLLSGFGHGMAVSVLPMYLAEIASSNIRGSLSTLITLMGKLGILYAYSIAPFVSIQAMCWIAMVPLILFIITFIWLPETPYYLLGKGNEEGARKSLIRLRGHNKITQEFECMKESVRNSQENRGSIGEFLGKNNRTALLIIIGLAAAQQFSGSFAILSYAHKIFDDVGDALGPNESAILLAAIQLISAGVASTIVDRWGRRPLLLLSSVTVVLCNLIVGVYFLLARFMDVSQVSTLATTSVLIFIIGYSIGLAPVPHAILSEIFPKNLKAIGGATHTMFNCLLSFGVTKLFQIVTDGIGNDYAFFGFTILSFIFLNFIYFKIPETKGKSLDVILVEMKSSNNAGSNVSLNSASTKISTVSFVAENDCYVNDKER